jgi:hypothetical protein
LPERDRTALPGKVLTDQQAPLRSRAAAVILLLYTQPLSRITRLTIDDVVRDGDQALLRLCDPPSPVPGPAAALLIEYLGRRTYVRTATQVWTHCNSCTTNSSALSATVSFCCGSADRSESLVGGPHGRTHMPARTSAAWPAVGVVTVRRPKVGE